MKILKQVTLDDKHLLNEGTFRDNVLAATRSDAILGKSVGLTGYKKANDPNPSWTEIFNSKESGPTGAASRYYKMEPTWKSIVMYFAVDEQTLQAAKIDMSQVVTINGGCIYERYKDRVTLTKPLNNGTDRTLQFELVGATYQVDIDFIYEVNDIENNGFVADLDEYYKYAIVKKIGNTRGRS